MRSPRSGPGSWRMRPERRLDAPEQGYGVGGGLGDTRPFATAPFCPDFSGLARAQDRDLARGANARLANPEHNSLIRKRPRVVLHHPVEERRFRRSSGRANVMGVRTVTIGAACVHAVPCGPSCRCGDGEDPSGTGPGTEAGNH